MEGTIMRTSTLSRLVVALALGASVPAFAGESACEHAVAKTSAKFVSATLKSARQCIATQAVGTTSTCRLAADTSASLQRHLERGLGPCNGGVVGDMGFQGPCGDKASGSFSRADLARCLASTHLNAIQGLVAVELGEPPQDTCGDGVIDADEDCDPAANPTGCDPGQACGAAGTEDECTCIDQTPPPGGGVCGNGVKDTGEECDPAAMPTGCPAGTTCGAACTCSSGGTTTTTVPAGGGTTTTTMPGGGGQVCSGVCTPSCGAGMSCHCFCSGGGGGSTTTTLPGGGGGTTTTTLPGGGGPCACGATPPTALSFTTTAGTGSCGDVKLTSGSTSKSLTCGGLYTGGGGNTVPLPYAVPDMSTSLTGVASCGGTTLALTNLTASTTGSSRNCTSSGCLFGAPLPIPNAGSPPTSVCVINTVARDATGSADCSTGTANIDLPLSSALYLTGDLLPDVAGIQPCPICTGGTCHGGPNDGGPCTPGSSALTDAFPTSHDCPPPPSANIGALPIGFNLTTGTASMTGHSGTGQNNIFCGFCRDADNTGCFQGDPNAAANGCPTPAGSPKACNSDSDCAAPYATCQQRNQGAFGPAGGGAHTISLTGAPAGNLVDGAGHASTLVGIFCIPPTFNATVDAAGDLPGPGAVSLVGTSKIQ
jgi:hypothetical protein